MIDLIADSINKVKRESSAEMMFNRMINCNYRLVFARLN